LLQADKNKKNMAPEAQFTRHPSPREHPDHNWFRQKGAEINVPAVNIKETHSEFQIEVAAPGMEKEDFDIHMENNTLVVSSELSKEKKEEEENYFRREFNYQAFCRTFDIPESMVEREKIDARYQDGILRIHLPKSEATKVKPFHKRIRIT
jgi:HSP20 family protein